MSAAVLAPWLLVTWEPGIVRMDAASPQFLREPAPLAALLRAAAAQAQFPAGVRETGT